MRPLEHARRQYAAAMADLDDRPVKRAWMVLRQRVGVLFMIAGRPGAPAGHHRSEDQHGHPQPRAATLAFHDHVGASTPCNSCLMRLSVSPRSVPSLTERTGTATC